MGPEASWSETQFRGNILTVCAEMGMVVNYHKRDELSPVTGWPDLEIVGPGGILYRELKTMNGVLSVAQRKMGSRLAAAGASWSTWRPIDWSHEIIRRQLLQISKESE